MFRAALISIPWISMRRTCLSHLSTGGESGHRKREGRSGDLGEGWVPRDKRGHPGGYGQGPAQVGRGRGEVPLCPPLQAKDLVCHTEFWAILVSDLFVIYEFPGCLLLLNPHSFIDSRNIYSAAVCQGPVWASEDTDRKHGLLCPPARHIYRTGSLGVITAQDQSLNENCL